MWVDVQITAVQLLATCDPNIRVAMMCESVKSLNPNNHHFFCFYLPLAFARHITRQQLARYSHDFAKGQELVCSSPMLRRLAWTSVYNWIRIWLHSLATCLRHGRNNIMLPVKGCQTTDIRVDSASSWILLSVQQLVLYNLGITGEKQASTWSSIPI